MTRISLVPVSRWTFLPVEEISEPGGLLPPAALKVRWLRPTTPWLFEFQSPSGEVALAGVVLSTGPLVAAGTLLRVPFIPGLFELLRPADPAIVSFADPMGATSAGPELELTEETGAPTA